MAFASALANAAESAVSDKEFLRFNLEHPEMDAAKALAEGRPRCFSVNGYNKSFPGIDADDKSFCERIERNISGTSDVGRSDHSEVQRSAWQYAEAYNKYVIAHVRDVHKG